MSDAAVSEGPPERRLWLVRHGETTGQSSVRFHGQNDVPLADLGRQQIRALGPWLLGTAFQRIVHSPLSRAAESAQILAELCGAPRERLCAEPALREISFGDCEGLTEAEIEARFPDFWREHRRGRTTGFPGGEPRAAFAARVAAWTQAMVQEPWTGDLLVVAHRGTVRQILRALFAVPLGTSDPFGVELGSLSVAREAGGWQLELLSAVP
ncbi:MAG: histidine phosphatase family protein [Planctomycetes bacterium]|nr:histidine phosphatase family protein [Planctomycetota bacterium]